MLACPARCTSQREAAANCSRAGCLPACLTPCVTRLDEAVGEEQDGLIEARNAQEEEFGIEQLQEICAQNHTAAAEALVARISAAVDRFVGGTPQYDDMASAVLKLDHHDR